MRRIIALVAAALACISVAQAEITKFLPDYSVFPPLHADRFFLETDCGAGGQTTAGDSNGWQRVSPAGGVGALQGLSSTSGLGGAAAICEFFSGTTAAATSATLITQALALNFANGTAKFIAVFTENVASNGTDTYVLRVGFQDFVTPLTASDPVDGCYFTYSHSLNGGKWLLVAHSNSSGGSSGVGGTNETTVDSGLTFTAATVRQLGVIATSTSCIFLNNGVQVGTTISTNVPTGASRLTGGGVLFFKTSATTTNTIPLYLDYMAIEQPRPTRFVRF